jgi:hypothetical protein
VKNEFEKAVKLLNLLDFILYNINGYFERFISNIGTFQTGIYNCHYFENIV